MSDMLKAVGFLTLFCALILLVAILGSVLIIHFGVIGYIVSLVAIILVGAAGHYYCHKIFG